MANDPVPLLEKLELHRSLKTASPGFHLSDEDIDTIIALLRNSTGKPGYTHYTGYRP